MHEATIAVHAHENPTVNAPVTTPIFVSSTYTWESFEEAPSWTYSREGHPNRAELEATVAALEGGRYGVAFGSGVAGISAALELAKAGDHVLVANDIYGGTYNLARHVLPDHGVAVTFFDSLRPKSICEAVQPNTKLLIFETPTNPTLQICDIEATVHEARVHGLTTIFDNTFATPILQKPLGFGVDIVCHSTTKYLGGHSDVVGGVVVTDKADLHQSLLAAATTIGGIPGPFDAWLVCRGLKSLYPRMRMHCESAMQVARYLETHRKLKKVNYPGLEGHPGHQLAKEQMKAFGAMLSFEIDGTAQEAMTFAKKCRLFKMAASLGGVESLISYPTKMSHAGLSEKERLDRGIPPTLLRVSIGLEAPEDLIEDLDQALGQC